eukprot:2791599-Alexandrium_andersonii.AAC.1
MSSRRRCCARFLSPRLSVKLPSAATRVARGSAYSSERHAFWAEAAAFRILLRSSGTASQPRG